MSGPKKQADMEQGPSQFNISPILFKLGRKEPSKTTRIRAEKDMLWSSIHMYRVSILTPFGKIKGLKRIVI
jgi:hypothetical protein